MNKKGYVYILSNKSYPNNWIKIGSTGRSMEERLKELNTTGVVLPFDIYATIQTKKYKEVEDILKNILDKLAGKRINPKREFFEIEPHEAYKRLSQIGNLCDDTIYNEPKKIEKHKKIINQKNNEKNLILGIIIEVMKIHGGKSSLQEIYKYFQSEYPEIYGKFKDKEHFESDIRATIYPYKKSSPLFKGTELFNSEGKGKGIKYILKNYN